MSVVVRVCSCPFAAAASASSRCRRPPSLVPLPPSWGRGVVSVGLAVALRLALAPVLAVDLASPIRSRPLLSPSAASCGGDPCVLLPSVRLGAASALVAASRPGVFRVRRAVGVAPFAVQPPLPPLVCGFVLLICRYVHCRAEFLLRCACVGVRRLLDGWEGECEVGGVASTTPAPWP